MAKQPTPLQAEQFHVAIHGQPTCFPDCCLCAATAELAELKDKIEDATCHRGHSDYPLTLWDCPVCVENEKEILRAKAQMLDMVIAADEKEFANLTIDLEKHPANYDGPCFCKVCWVVKDEDKDGSWEDDFGVMR